MNKPTTPDDIQKLHDKIKLMKEIEHQAKWGRIWKEEQEAEDAGFGKEFDESELYDESMEPNEAWRPLASKRKPSVKSRIASAGIPFSQSSGAIEADPVWSQLDANDIEDALRSLAAQADRAAFEALCSAAAARGKMPTPQTLARRCSEDMACGRPAAALLWIDAPGFDPNEPGQRRQRLLAQALETTRSPELCRRLLAAGAQIGEGQNHIGYLALSHSPVECAVAIFEERPGKAEPRLQAAMASMAAKHGQLRLALSIGKDDWSWCAGEGSSPAMQCLASQRFSPGHKELASLSLFIQDCCHGPAEHFQKILAEAHAILGFSKAMVLARQWTQMPAGLEQACSQLLEAASLRAATVIEPPTAARKPTL